MAVSSVENNLLLQSYANTQTASTAAAETDNSLWGNFDTFLKILTAQLQNQDPTQPMDASEFTNQLVQYASVEQQISTNDKLDTLLGTVNSNGITPLLGYVGQYVEAQTDNEIVVQGGAGLLAYTLPSEALSVTLSVQDSNGNVIASIDGPTNEGLNRIAWDGSLESGGTAADGVYSFVLTAKDSTGDTIDVTDIRVIGQVSSIETDKNGDMALMLGDLAIADTDILSVFAGVAASSSTGDQTTDTSEETETAEETETTEETEETG